MTVLEIAERIEGGETITIPSQYAQTLMQQAVAHGVTADWKMVVDHEKAVITKGSPDA